MTKQISKLLLTLFVVVNVTWSSSSSHCRNDIVCNNISAVLLQGCDYQADVCWLISNTVKQTSVAKCQILSNRRLLANLKYYQADDVNLGFESELKFLYNG